MQPASGSMQPVLLPPTNTPKQDAPMTGISTPDDVMAIVKPVLNAELVHAVDAVYAFQIMGEKGGTYYLDLKTGMYSLLNL